MQERLSVNEIFNQMVPRILEERPEIARRVNAIVGVELVGDSGGYWTLDLTRNPAIEKGKTKEPKCTIIAHVEDFEALISGGSMRDALDAFKKKRIRASGHLPTILKLEHLILSLSKR